MTKRRQRFVTAALPAALLILGCCVASAKPPVDIEITPARIKRDSYPPGRPPPHLSLFRPEEEAGLCHTTIRCAVDIQVTYPRIGVGSITATVSNDSVTTYLSIVVWHAEDSAFAIPHEETHREIAEHYYTLAGPVARRLAEKLIGRKIVVPAKNRDEAIQENLALLRDQLDEDFHREVAERNAAAQEFFDDVTDHGREPILNADAKARALAKEAAAWEAKNSSAAPVPQAGDLKK